MKTFKYQIPSDERKLNFVSRKYEGKRDENLSCMDIEWSSELIPFHIIEKLGCVVSSQ